jgi:hypothetical protein
MFVLHICLFLPGEPDHAQDSTSAPRPTPKGPRGSPFRTVNQQGNLGRQHPIPSSCPTPPRANTLISPVFLDKLTGPMLRFSDS